MKLLNLLRKPYLSILTAFLFLFTSCSQYETGESENFDKKNVNEITTVSNKLSENKDFIEFFKRITEFSKHSFDTKKIDYLVEKDYLNVNERTELSKELGFKSTEEAYKYDIQNFNAITNVYELFDLKMFSNNELFIIYNKAFKIISNNLYNSKRSNGSCEDRLSNCNIGAGATYALTVTGCVAMGIGVGAASFWCAGCLGAGLGAACVTAAAVMYSSDLNSCYYNYQDCTR